jgi:hypothetical protein
MITPKQLQQRFAYMFAGDNIGISIPTGWMPEFAKLCEQIDELLGDDKHGFHWRQCKEKFGSARWYWTMRGERKQALRIDIISNMQAVSTTLKSSKPTQPVPSLQDQIGELIGKAEAHTQHACIMCGQNGKLDQQEAYVLVLCAEHARQRSCGTLPDFWFEDDEEGDQ